MTVKHSTTIVGSDDPAYDVSSDGWNADHTGTNNHGHSATGDGGTLNVEDLATGSTDASKVFAPDGAGGIQLVAPSGVADIVDIPTAETDTALVLAPDGVGGVGFRTETGGGGGAPLGITRYQGGSDTSVNTTSTSTVDADATNMKVTFTAPASGNVLVEVGAFCQNAGSQMMFLGLREGTTNVVTKQAVLYAASAIIVFVRRSFYLTGLSAGSHTYKLSYCTNGGTVYLYFGPSYGAIEMTVWAA